MSNSLFVKNVCNDLLNKHMQKRAQIISNLETTIKVKIKEVESLSTTIKESRVKQQRLVLLYDCLTSIGTEMTKGEDDVKAIISSIDSKEISHQLNWRELSDVDYMANVENKLNAAQDYVNTVIAQSEALWLTANYDCIIFISLDYAQDSIVLTDVVKGGRVYNRGTPTNQGLGVGIRQKQINNRGLNASFNGAETHPVNHNKKFTYNSISIREYTLSHDTNKHYIEVTIGPPQGGDYLTDFTTNGTPVIDQFKYLTDNSKIVIAGHGSFRSTSVQSDAQSGTRRKTYSNGVVDEERFNMPIMALANLIVDNIERSSPVKFTDQTNPLSLVSQSCQAGGLDGSGNLTVNQTGTGITQRIHRNGGSQDVSFSIEETMAGQFLNHFKSRGVWAKIKARTTSSQSVKSEKRSGPVNLSDVHRPDLSDAQYEGAAQNSRLGQIYEGANKINRFNRETRVDAFHNLAKKQLVTQTFQGQNARAHGLKRLFYYDASGKMQCKDLANDMQVDLYFEANKDRVLLYLVYNAFHVSDNGRGTLKRKSLLESISKIERSACYDDIINELTNMLGDPLVIGNTSSISSFFGNVTRTQKVLTALRKLVQDAKAKSQIIPLPNKNRSNLGLTLV